MTDRYVEDPFNRNEPPGLYVHATPIEIGEARQLVALFGAERRLRAERINMALAEIGFSDVLGPRAELLREDVPPPVVFRAWKLAFPELPTTYDEWLIDCLALPWPPTRWLERHNAHPYAVVDR